ncbi:MAG: twitching motility protein PilT [Candidatus Gottesmanbacteria bacterium GW2011_GWA2_43_14]|uniref:Twitching motility protein PilT n=1 Tax=Candidatus Gottesmanbacteria bacterium GW2011_GWA2_43_14 TaxID=1618443 RepID=A0A0G1DJG6_9BACT|nr:MAG: twitching motility protein PilT [Candidatus Gottesmanbacteria bacterium GW2011_GWA2_43_14]
MNYLLDTHTLIWALVSPEKLSLKVKKIILDNTSWISVVSFWEISLKYTIGKLNLQNVKPDEIRESSIKTGFTVLDLDSETAATFYKLPRIKNKDPFDLMLAWQAISGNFTLLSKDKGFDIYRLSGLKRVW